MYYRSTGASKGIYISAYFAGHGRGQTYPPRPAQLQEHGHLLCCSLKLQDDVHNYT